MTKARRRRLATIHVLADLSRDSWKNELARHSPKFGPVRERSEDDDVEYLSTSEREGSRSNPTSIVTLEVVVAQKRIGPEIKAGDVVAQARAPERFPLASLRTAWRF